MYDIMSQINLITTLILVGLIWTIQLVHYPSFHYVAEEKFSEFEKFHTTRMTIIVAPLMLCEMIASGWLVYFSGYSVKPIAGLAMVVLIWLVTGLISVPCHKKLEDGKDSATITRLVNTNWIRTVLWSAKGVLLLVW